MSDIKIYKSFSSYLINIFKNQKILEEFFIELFQKGFLTFF